MKLPEPTMWMTPSGDGFMMRWKPPVTEVAMGWDAMFTEAQLREALASHEAAMRQVLELLGPQAPECCGCRAEWDMAIDVLESALK